MKKQTLRRFAAMGAGNLLIAVGIALFQLSRTGADPNSGMIEALSTRLGLDFAVGMLAMNTLYFAAELLFCRELVGPGTFVNWVLIGPAVSLITASAGGAAAALQGWPARLALVGAGLVIQSLGCALYQVADQGISPYDSLSLALSRKTPVPYARCRILTDGACVLLTLLLGGVVGVGTLVCCAAMGPLVQRFSKTVQRRLLEEE